MKNRQELRADNIKNLFNPPVITDGSIISLNYRNNHRIIFGESGEIDIYVKNSNVTIIHNGETYDFGDLSIFYSFDDLIGDLSKQLMLLDKSISLNYADDKHTILTYKTCVSMSKMVNKFIDVMESFDQYNRLGHFIFKYLSPKYNSKSKYKLVAQGHSVGGSYISAQTAANEYINHLNNNFNGKRFSFIGYDSRHNHYTFEFE